MKIIQIAPRVPYPLTEGGSIGIFNITRQLRRNGAEILFTAVTPQKDADVPEELRRLCSDIFVARTDQRYGLSLGMRNVLSGVPINVQKYHSRKILSEILAHFSKTSVDIIHVDHLHMAYYGLALGRVKGAPVVLREHNFELKIMQRFAETSQNPLYRAYAGYQVSKFKKYEPAICAKMDKCVMITDEDRRRLLELQNGIDTTVIPAGVDTNFFVPDSAPGGEGSVAYIGSLDWLPNVEGIKWFIRDVFPMIVKVRPDVKFYIYGKNPSRELFKLSDGKHVFVEGFVDDVRDVFRKARVMVVPLRAGSGMRIKILEAMAAGKSLVTTSIGSEGIKCEDGKNIMIADGEQMFAKKVTELLGDDRLRRTIGSNAAALASTEYSWDRIGEMFWSTYQELIRKYKEGGLRD